MNDYIKRKNALNAFNNAFYSGLAAKIKEIPSEDVTPVRHGRWKFSVHEERMRKFVVDAECSECGSMKFEVWGGFFPDAPNIVAEAIALENAEKTAMPNYCEDCGAKMDGGNE